MVVNIILRSSLSRYNGGFQKKCKDLIKPVLSQTNEAYFLGNYLAKDSGW